MTDREVSAETGQKSSDTRKSVELFPRLSGDTDTRPQKSDDARSANTASYSLGRLEQDLRLLHTKWQAVEKEMAERDREVAALQQALDSQQDEKSELEADLAEVSAEKKSLSAELSTALAKIEDLKSRADDYDRTILARDAEIDVVRSEHESLLTIKEQLENDLAEQKGSTSTASDRLSEFESENLELRIHLQELQAYIDGRKNDWDTLNAKIRQYKDTIQGMSKSLDAHDEVVAEVEEQKASLALKVMDLERELAELKGRYTERESSQAILQQSLDDQSRELGKLNTETTGLRKQIGKLQKDLDRKESKVCALRKRLKDRDGESSSLEGMLAEEKTSIARLQESLRASQERVADLEAEQKERDSNAGELGATIGKLRERLRLSEPAVGMHELRITELESCVQAGEATAKELRDELAHASVNLKELGQKAAEHEIRAAEMHAALVEMESKKNGVEKELEAQRELVDVLEFELRNKQDNLDILDRSVDRLSAIRSEIRDLDVQIDEHWLEQPEEVLLSPEELLGDPEELVKFVIVSDEEESGEPARYSLTGKEMTIGRSRNSDIQIDNKYISRVHARIRIDGSCVTIEDAGSKNGFLVNSVHSTRHTLAHGDELEIGGSKFHYLDMSST